MGIQKIKSNEIYIGDFVKNKKHGFGMLLVSEESKIKELPETSIYVGRWQDDKKDRSGRCYNREGTLIYDGDFSKDSPIHDFPQSPDSLQKLIYSTNKLGDVYIGESFGGIFHGFGLLIMNNGDQWISKFRDGYPIGVGLYISANGEWKTVNSSDNGKLTVMSSSQEYNSLESSRKEFVSSCISEAIGAFSNALIIASNVSANGIKSSDLTDFNTESHDYVSSRNNYSTSNNYQSMYLNWEKRAKQNYGTLTNLGYSIKKNDKNIAGNSGHGASSSNYVLQKKYLREAQREMTRIREKAMKNGVTIPQSEYETVTVSY